MLQETISQMSNALGVCENVYRIKEGKIFFLWNTARWAYYSDPTVAKRDLQDIKRQFNIKTKSIRFLSCKEYLIY